MLLPDLLVHHVALGGGLRVRMRIKPEGVSDLVRRDVLLLVHPDGVDVAAGEAAADLRPADIVFRGGALEVRQVES